MVQLCGLPAGVVSVEGEPLRAVLLQQNHPNKLYYVAKIGKILYL